MPQRETSTVWSKVRERLQELARNDELGWCDGQDRSLRWMAERLAQQNGVLIADEPGMGKTRLALAALYAVLAEGGTAAVVAPPGLLRQWEAEWDKLRDRLGRYDTRTGNKRYSPVLLRSYNSLFNRPDYQFALADNAERQCQSSDQNRPDCPFPLANDGWLLLSQRFGPPSIINGTRNKAGKATYVLPFFISALLREKDGQHRRNAHWQCVKRELFEYDKCIATQCGECTAEQWDECRNECGWHIAVNRAAHYLMSQCDGDCPMSKELFGINDLPEKGIEGNLEDVRKWFKNEKGGLHAIGALLGPVDLLIVDEAHKGRGETRLSCLLDDIIHVKNGGKRIALTATPMELKPTQWQTMFGRIGESDKYENTVKQKIEAFDRVRAHSQNNPNSRNAIEGLCLTCKDFIEAIQPYMSRRLRRNQKDFQDLVGKDACDQSAHPHHEWKPVAVNWANVPSQWRPSLFALEALGKAIKGLPRPDKCKDKKELRPVLVTLQPWRTADIRYAAGQRATGEKTQPSENDKDKDEERSDVAGVIAAIDKYLQSDVAAASAVAGKLTRARYWLNKLDSNDADLTTHPRIQQAADEIERIVWAEDRAKREKVLAFGTYVKPLQALHTLLNRRAVLRLLDDAHRDGRVALVPSESTDVQDNDEKQALWDEYERLEAKAALRVVYRSCCELDQAVDEAAKEYEKRRDGLERLIGEQFVRTLPGDAAIEGTDEWKKVAKWLRTELMNHRLFQGTADLATDDDVKRAAFHIWGDFIRSFVDADERGDDEERKESKTAWTVPDYLRSDDSLWEAASRLDARADHVSFSQIQAELDEDSGRRGTVARLLRGGIRMETRHNLQAKFNRANAFPFVLIAQSQVGREGLNLHEACRTVVQLHPEWNPGVVEQQVGRVDRINSWWEKLAKAWKSPDKEDEKDRGKVGTMPKIRVLRIVFKGTYDEFQSEVLQHRRQTLNAHLFGEILDEEALQRVPPDLREKIREAAPDFEPPPVSDRSMQCGL